MGHRGDCPHGPLREVPVPGRRCRGRAAGRGGGAERKPSLVSFQMPSQDVPPLELSFEGEAWCLVFPLRASASLLPSHAPHSYLTHSSLTPHSQLTHASLSPHSHSPFRPGLPPHTSLAAHSQLIHLIHSSLTPRSPNSHLTHIHSLAHEQAGIAFTRALLRRAPSERPAAREVRAASLSERASEGPRSNPGVAARVCGGASRSLLSNVRGSKVKN